MVEPMTRFDWQRHCCQRVPGPVLNVGCKEDPAALKATFGARVTNLDRWDYDEAWWKASQTRVPIPVDVLHDILTRPWPFAADTFDVVVLGDILEDLPPGTQPAVLQEAARVGTALCVTCPEDTPTRDPHHLTTIPAADLRAWLGATGWRVIDFFDVDYGFVPHGWWVWADRTREGGG